MVNSLAQLVLKMTSPGVPDFYQGTELWDLSLVDPDNRRAVDYEERRRILESLAPHLDGTRDRRRFVSELFEAWPDGRIKMWIMASGLRARNAAAALFRDGEYLPLEVQGDRSEHVVAYARALGGEAALTVVPRLTLALTSPSHPMPIGARSWGDTRVEIPPALMRRAWRNALSGETVRADDGTLRLAEALETLPVALLIGV
jgi:(1->4)-alpha-D-glucan 1-alpha-D-glucosylmutase